MKILITNTGPWGTGSFTVSLAISKELEALGHKVKIFFPDRGLPSSDLNYFYSNQEKYIIWKFPIERNEIRLEDFPLMIPDPHPRVIKERTFKELSEEELTLYFENAKEALSKVLQEFQPDIVECQHVWMLERAIEELNYPFICTAHHSDQMGFEFDPRMQPIAIKGAHSASYIFAISEFVKNEVIRLYGVPPEKVIILGNGYDKAIFRPLDVNKEAVLKEFKLDIPDDATIISFAGKLSKTKGIDILLEANRILCKTKNVHFLIFGSGALEKTLRPNGMERYCFERMHFLGYQDPKTLAIAHNISDFSILPSRTEGFGLSALEAMGCGLPVIATDSGGLPEYVVGKIVPPDDPQALADAIAEMADLNRVQYRALSEHAFERANSFSWHYIAERRVEYYQKAIAQHKSLK